MMKTLIAYSSKYGCTEQCACQLSSLLSGEVEVIDLRVNKAVDIDRYDQVVLGGSIYTGQSSKAVRDFCLINVTALESKRIGLFLCCFDQGKNAREYLARTFPEVLINQAVAVGYLGWEVHWDRLNAMERWMIKMFTGIQGDTSRIDEAKIVQFSLRMQG